MEVWKKRLGGGFMEKENFLSQKALFFLTVNLLCFKSFSGGFKNLISQNGSGAFFAEILCFGFSVGSAFLILFVLKKTRCKNIFDLTKKYLPQGICFFIKALILCWVGYVFAKGIYVSSNILKSAVFDNAPFVFVALFFFVGAFYSMKSGVFATAKGAEVVVPISLFIICAMLFFAFWGENFSNIYPLLGYGAKSTFFSAVNSFFGCFDFVLIFLVFPFDFSDGQTGKTLAKAVVFGALLNVITVFSELVSLSPNIAKQTEFTLYILFKTVDLERFMQRTDALYVFAASIYLMSYVSVVGEVVILGLKELLCISNEKILASCVSLLGLLGALAVKNEKTGVACNFYFGFAAVVLICLILSKIIFLKNGRQKNEM